MKTLWLKYFVTPLWIFDESRQETKEIWPPRIWTAPVSYGIHEPNWCFCGRFSTNSSGNMPQMSFWTPTPSRCSGSGPCGFISARRARIKQYRVPPAPNCCSSPPNREQSACYISVSGNTSYISKLCPKHPSKEGLWGQSIKYIRRQEPKRTGSKRQVAIASATHLSTKCPSWSYASPVGNTDHGCRMDATHTWSPGTQSTQSTHSDVLTEEEKQNRLPRGSHISWHGDVQV